MHITFRQTKGKISWTDFLTFFGLSIRALHLWIFPCVSKVISMIKLAGSIQYISNFDYELFSCSKNDSAFILFYCKFDGSSKHNGLHLSTILRNVGYHLYWLLKSEFPPDSVIIENTSLITLLPLYNSVGGSVLSVISLATIPVYYIILKLLYSRENSDVDYTVVAGASDN